MKTNLSKRKKGRLDSSLFLRTFSLLALLVVGIGVSWAQDASLDFNVGTWGYTASKQFSDGSTATFAGGSGDDMRSDCITLGSSASLTIKAKDGSAIKGMMVIFKPNEGHDLTFNGNAVAVNNNSALWISENAVNEIVITNTTASSIARVELIYDSKNKLITDYTVADGKISLDISKLNAYRKHAYSTTTSSLYSTASGYDAYSFIEFEKPIDLSGLTNLTVNYSGDNIVNHIEFYAATGGAILPKYGSTNIDYTDAERAQLTSVKKIQIGSNTQKGKMDISSIVLTLTHIDPSARMINAKEINTYTGKKVVLTGEVTGGSCKPKCIWNKATKNADDSYTLDPTAVAYQDNYEFTPTETGDYYFAVRAYQQNCGHDGKSWNTSALDINNVVKVHVDLGYTVSWDAAQVPSGCDAWYTIGDNPEKIRTTSSGIAPGTTITYTATDGTDNNWVINGWYKVDVPTSGDGGFFKYSNTYSENISANLDVRPEFQNTHIYIANAGDNGTAIVYAASDDNKVNISGNKYKSWEMTGGVKFEAQATSGYEFVQWNDGNKDNPRTVTEHADGTTYTYTAQFAKALVILNYKPQCNHYGDRTHGDNYFDINCLNPEGGVTIGVADNGTGKKINVPTNGGSVKFVFKEAYNYRDLVGWTISDNADLRARVSCVEFFRDADCTDRVVDFWTGSGDRSGINDSRFAGVANNVKAIKISFKNATDAKVDGEVSYDINWMCFKFEHADRTYPTLTEGTEPVMYFYNDVVGEKLVLSNTPGYWREYTDDTYETEKGGTGTGLVPTDQYRTRYEYSATDLPTGNYYFGAKDGDNCALGYRHESDLVKVHVISTTAPTDFHITYDWNIGEGNPVIGDVPVDYNNYTYKQEANIMGPGQISREGYFFSYWSVTPDGSGTRYSNNAENGETTIKMLQNRTLYAIWNKEGFEGYFNYENRLIAQWNIDLADGARLHEPSMDGSIWSNSGAVGQPDGKTKTTYTLSSDIDFGELVYGGSNSGVKIPVFAGLKFKANANEVKIVVTKKGDEIMNTQLVLAEGVQLQIPYVRNSYRDDGGNAQSPYGWNDRFIAKGTTWGGKTYDKDTWGVVYKDEFRPARFTDMQDCIHHINRDIVYIVAQPDIWEAMTNKCYDDDTKDLFNSGGDEDVHGLRNGEKKIWKKLNFCGNQGTPCIITFQTETTIDRIGVNRNLTYSFYTENIAANSEGAYSKPFPGLRIVGSPKGAKVADVGDTYATYGNAIAMTYGGWAHNGNEFKDGAGTTITDGWGNMTVYYGDQTSAIKEGTNSYDATQFTYIDVKLVPVATDGFPVYSKEISHAYSETVNPTKTTNDFIGANKTAGKSYHDQNYGNFLLHPDDGGSQAYVENYNPWTLPCRGAYAKFEPTLPGVLNVHILQEPGQEYYIADEFGRLIKEQIFVKTGTSNTTLTNSNGHISINQKDNVKYSFDVYPGKTYYLFSNTAGMGITGFYFEPYVYRKYHALADAPATSYDTNGYIVKDQNEEYELARQDVGLKTAVMTAGPVFSFSSETFDYTNQTAGYHGGTTKNLNKDTGEQITKDDGNGNQVPDVQTYPAQPKTAAGSYPNKTNNVNPLIYDNKAVHVILERSFTKEKWSTIVLPYSMNNLQLETVFGKGTKVVLLRDVQDKSTSPNHKTTINFVYHENQDIIAGYPYMIYPTLEGMVDENEIPITQINRVETNAYLDKRYVDQLFSSALPGEYEAPSIVEISAVGPNLVTYPNASNNYGGLSCFKWEASYDNATDDMPVGSYVMSDNNMRRVNEGNRMKAGAFKGYLKYVGDQGLANVRMLEAINFGGDDADEATAIENLLFDAGIIGGKTNVYSINGQLIRENTDDLRGLEKGIYIVNGKKYIVR